MKPTEREMEALTAPARQRPRICLCMIVKDEAAVIERLVNSVAGHIDSYYVVDTGSSDDTLERLIARMDDHGISGYVDHQEWVDFGHNRSWMLRQARGRADWLLLMDADWTLERVDTHIAKAGDDIPFGPQTLLQFAGGDEAAEVDCWLVAAAGGFQMTHKVLVKGDRPWKAVGKIHEVVGCDEPFTQALLQGVAWTHHADSGTRDTRAGGDERILRDAIAEDPTDSRSTFYLAQTLKDMGRTEEAVAFYRLRARMGGWEQEVYLSLLYAGRLAVELGWADNARMGLLFEAWAVCPGRLEARYELVAWLRTQGRYAAGWTLLGPHPEYAGSVNVREWLSPADAVFAEGWVADYGLRFEESILAYWVGEYDHAIELATLLLQDPAVPDNYKDAAGTNLAEAEAAKAAASSRVRAVEQARKLRLPR